jgi:hypothetical protein
MGLFWDSSTELTVEHGKYEENIRDLLDLNPTAAADVEAARGHGAPIEELNEHMEGWLYNNFR